MRNGYVDLCLEVQAVRRYFEGIRTPLAPAIGVAASLYTHQIANVQRVLTDVRVRHLLADEVGLGKTVQALMMLNALRSQRDDLQALIVVPNQLVPQWRDEILTRAHSAPIGEGDEFETGQYIRLAWEAQLGMHDAKGNPVFSLADINPYRFDVLVIDELHRLREDVQDRIVRIAADFEHILILTATPTFQHAKRHAQLFALLEPERAALARSRIATEEEEAGRELAIGDDLSKWPRWAAASVVDELVERDRVAAAAAEQETITAAALAHCVYRRVIRTRRADYSGVLPHRRHRSLVVEPLGAESERQSLMWQYFGHLNDLSRRFDPVSLAKRVILSPPSLEQRVDFFRRQGHERDGLLERVKPLVHRSQGDSRADALVDLLTEIWTVDPTERVLVAAQDNLTVDYLFDLVQARLPEVGPLSRRTTLVAARVRQGMMTEAVDDLGGFGNETNENLEAFQRGEAQILFAPEAVQVGLNLQCARVLVLYSVPWRPQEVEQWIGRLDRIGNVAAFSNGDEENAIDVYTIAQRGLVDEKVVSVLQRFHVFERSVNLDGDHLVEVTKLIEDAALRPERVSWSELEDATEAMAAEDEVQEFDSALRKHLPWTARSAIVERQWLDSLPPAAPVLKALPKHSTLGPRAWDRALEGTLSLLSRAGDYHIRWNTDPETGCRFRSLWYQFGERGMYGRRDPLSKVVFSFGANPSHERSPQHAHAFITRRGDIGNPARRSVTMKLNEIHVRRPLQFVSFGNALHDELIKGWLPRDEGLVTLEVAYFEDHALWSHGNPGLYLIRLSIIDPGNALIGGGLDEQLLHSVGPLLKFARCALEADIRWIRAQFTACMTLDVRRWEKGSWVQVDAEEADALLNPMAHKREGLPMAKTLRISKAECALIQSELSKQRQADVMAARSAWSHRFPDFRASLTSRLLVVEEEGRDAVALVREELHRVEEALRIAQERGNRAQITRTENARDATVETLRATKAFWGERARWLRESEDRVRRVIPDEKLKALLRTQKVS